MVVFELIQAVLGMSKGMSRPAYRGHAKAKWTVDSGAVRRLVAAYGDEVLQDEDALRQLVRQYQTDELIIPMKVIGGEPMTDVQMLSVLQHQGAATMLLDFTENPLVALWFACADKPKSGVDPNSWTPDPLGRRYPPCRMTLYLSAEGRQIKTAVRAGVPAPDG